MKIRPFTAHNHKKGHIDLRDLGVIRRMLPTEIHLKEDGSIKDKESFAIVLERPGELPVVGEITMEMFNEALDTIGYEIIKKDI